MSDHKPECVLSDPCSADEPRHGFCGHSAPLFCMHCEQQCDCDRIKRAEDRVRGEHDEYRAMLGGIEFGAERSWDYALDAALGAVKDLRGCLGTDDNGDGTVWVEKADALDAIDALRRSHVD